MILYLVPHCSIVFLKSSRPSLLIKRAALGNLKASFHCTHWHRFFPLKKDFFESLRLPFQRELHLSPRPSLLRREGGNRPTRCSEPLRYKVGGASKPSPYCAGWDRLTLACWLGVHGDSMLIGTAWLMFGFQHKHINSIVVLLLFYNFEVFLMHATDGYCSSTEVEDELAVTVYADNVAFIVFEWSCKDTQLHVVFG